MLEGLGLSSTPLPWLDRSLLVKRVRALVPKPPAPTTAAGEVAVLRAERLAVFARNAVSFVGVARAHRARVLLVTLPLRRRGTLEPEDDKMFAYWTPDPPDTRRGRPRSSR